MTFLNPWGLLALLAVPALICLYILKQKHKELKVPGLLLWKKAGVMLQASTPWQKLRRSLLFFLQLAAVTLLALAVANPCLHSDAVYNELTVIIDASASMQAQENGKTRYEKAEEQCISLAESLRSGQKMSVIFAADTVYPAVSHTDSRLAVRQALRSYQGCLYGGSDLDSALLLAEGMMSGDENSKILVLTDREVSSDDPRVSYINLAEGRDNTALLSFRCGRSGNSLLALSVVETFGSDREVTLELYNGDTLCDAKKVSLTAGRQENIYWSDLPADASLLTVKIREDDILAADNSLSCDARSRDTLRLLLVSENGFFLEKVLSAVSGYELYKIAPADYTADSAAGYQLCVFDGYTPDTLPSGCAYWLVHPNRSADGVTVGAEIRGSVLSPVPHVFSEEICEFLNPSAVSVSGFAELTLADGWQPVLNCGEYPALAVRMPAAGYPCAVFAFDLHNSNLPLLKEYPILIRNLLSFTLPEMLEGDGAVTVGAAVPVRPLAYAREIRVTDPAGKTEKLSGDSFSALLPGLYTVEETVVRTLGDKEETSVQTGYTAAQIPPGESAMETSPVGGGTAGNTQTGSVGQLSLRPWLMAAVMLLLLAEWWVYHRETQY